MEGSRLVKEFTKGLWKEIPPFRFVLGLCPTLACTTAVRDGIGMGLCLTFVLVCSNILISLLRKVTVSYTHLTLPTTPYV